jgi:hypothetical protein
LRHTPALDARQWRPLRFGLRELIDPLLQQLLVGAQIRQLVGADRPKTSQQSGCCCQSADRCKSAEIPLSSHYALAPALLNSWLSLAGG